MGKKNFLVLGAGRFGISVAETLDYLGHEVCVIDKNADIIQDIAENVTHAIVGDCCEATVLKSIGAANFDTVIVALSEDMQASILATVLLKEMGVKNVMTRATDEMHRKILEKVGADEVLMPEREMGERLAHMLVAKKRFHDLELSSEFSVVQIECPSKWVGRNPVSLDARNRYGINIIAVERGDDVLMALTDDDVFKRDDIIVIVGKNSDIKDLEK